MLIRSTRVLRLVSCAYALQAITQRSYSYDGWKCSYRYLDGAKDRKPLLLIHPVGIGLSSWFYEPLMEALHEEYGGEVFAPDLIGCGASEAWDPGKRGLFIPLDYARQCEELWRLEIGRPCVVVVQGGLAPVGVSLAARRNDLWDGPRAVENLVLASPPSWDVLAGGSSKDAVARNYDLWSGPLGKAGYKILRRRSFVRFFSNLFLFANKADERWIESCCDEAKQIEKQWPVFAFNAGIVNARGLYDDLVELKQRTLILEGIRDSRKSSRDAYLDFLQKCKRHVVDDALNVLPWEAPNETARLLAALCT
ncbi:hypothetical protein CTAYLR_001507 [Chrysophaeum taylorii]|uniref:AB hydrolase-1 domain-containing protein n=1 Tax=Chrysophaeum taylorii TaxID=2483200 RepID=A0AAD7UD60_9STRA|nr:hypothetical protein CTAYLR_001507 [Chrysophaeum taylorii]